MDEKRITEEENRLGRLARDYAEVFTTDTGKRVLADLSRFCGFERTSFCGENPHRTAFFEGQRNVCLYILDRLKRAENPSAGGSQEEE
ncbi:MAG: hypothetical protein ACLFOY_14715 [Desulfatibacillaceae bacterium]